MDKYLEQFPTLSLFSRFFDRPDFFCKKMFGGLACYLNGLMVACLTESDITSRTWKGKNYPFPLWYGVLIPTERIHQPSLMAEINGAISHPVLGKWLYLSIESEYFEDSMKIFIRLLSAGDPRLGIVPGLKKKKKRQNMKKRGPVQSKSKGRTIKI